MYAIPRGRAPRAYGTASGFAVWVFGAYHYARGYGGHLGPCCGAVHWQLVVSVTVTVTPPWVAVDVVVPSTASISLEVPQTSLCAWAVLSFMVPGASVVTVVVQVTHFLHEAAPSVARASAKIRVLVMGLVLVGF